MESGAAQEISESLHVGIFSVDPEGGFRLQRLVDLFRVSGNALKLPRFRVSHHQVTDAEDVVGHHFKEFSQTLVDELPYRYCRGLGVMRGRLE